MTTERHSLQLTSAVAVSCVKHFAKLTQGLGIRNNHQGMIITYPSQPTASTGTGGICPEGYYCPSGASAPEVCTPGSYCSQSGLGTPENLVRIVF